MNTYLNSINAGVMMFPFLAFVLTVPYAVYNYRKYGSVPFWKTFVFFTFVFYLLVAYLLTMLPFPDCRVAAECGAVSIPPDWVPFSFWPDFVAVAQQVGLSIDPRTWIEWMKHPNVYTVLFNVLLTFPLGVYARYVFKFNWWKALILGFCVSLSFELIQLSGLCGIYDYAYRTCETNDLITNTFGCVLGCLVAKPLIWFLPKWDDLNGRALTRGIQRVSFMRRFFGFVVDITLVIVCSIIGELLILTSGGPAFYDWLITYFFVGIFFMVVPSITHGQTLGHKIVRLRIVHTDGRTPSPLAYVARYGLLVWGMLFGPIALLNLMPDTVDNVSGSYFVIIFAAGYVIWFITIIIRAIRGKFGHPFMLVTDALTDTMLVPVKKGADDFAGDHVDDLAEA